MQMKIQLVAGALAFAVAQGASAAPTNAGTDAPQVKNGKATASTDERGTKPQLMTASVDHTAAMADLLQAAQELRESIQALAQQPAGAKRSAAIDAAQGALLDTQRAMLELPADLRIESRDRKAASDWPKAMARLDQAADLLHDSVEAMSRQQSIKASDQSTDKAVAAVRDALEGAQQAMLALPDYSS